MEELQEVQPTKRPNSLKVPVILSAVYIIVSFLSGIFGLIGGKPSEEEMEESKVELLEQVNEMKNNSMDSMAEMLEKVQLMNEDVMEHFVANSLLSLVILMIGGAGVYLMHNYKKLGFHLYIIYSILGVVGIYIFSSPAHVPQIVWMWNLVISLLFIALYARNLKLFK